MKSIFEITEASRQNAGLQQVEKVNVVIGKMHYVVLEVLQLYFNLMKKEFQGYGEAVLNVTERDPVLRCKDCRKTIHITEACFICSYCRSINTEVIQGNEFYLESIEGTNER